MGPTAAVGRIVRGLLNFNKCSKQSFTQSICNIPSCTLWKCERSPASRAVLMTLDALKLTVEENEINMDKKEHKSPELVIHNPLLTLPILKDHKLVLIDSHAILPYLASRYRNDGSFLPIDAGGRSRVDQLLHYNNSVIYPRYKEAVAPFFAKGNPFLGKKRSLTPKSECEILCTYGDLECLLQTRPWFCGPNPTLADIAIAASVSTLDVLVPVKASVYRSLAIWLSRVADEEYFISGNLNGLNEFKIRISDQYAREIKESERLVTSIH